MNNKWLSTIYIEAEYIGYLRSWQLYIHHPEYEHPSILIGLWPIYARYAWPVDTRGPIDGDHRLDWASLCIGNRTMKFIPHTLENCLEAQPKGTKYNGSVVTGRTSNLLSWYLQTPCRGSEGAQRPFLQPFVGAPLASHSPFDSTR